MNERLPASTLCWLREVPESRTTAMLLRHAERPAMVLDGSGCDQPITEVGARLARELGRVCGPRLRTLHTSPLRRCVETAEAMRSGAAVDLPVETSRLLGDPGVYVVDDQIAAAQWVALGHEAVMAHLAGADHPLPGMASPEVAAWTLIEHMLTVASKEPGLHVFVTHDSVLTATVARSLRKPFGPESWPAYLEAGFFWREGGAIHAAYRDLLRVGVAFPRARR